MHLIRSLPVLALALLAAACSQDSRQLLTPGNPLHSTWERTYTIGARTYEYQGPKPFNPYMAEYVGGYVKVELVPDNTLMGAYEIGRVDANWGSASFFKPANNALRLTAVPTLSRCTFRGWYAPTSSSALTTQNPVNMDDYHPNSDVRADFLCTP